MLNDTDVFIEIRLELHFNGVTAAYKALCSRADLLNALCDAASHMCQDGILGVPAYKVAHASKP